MQNDECRMRNYKGFTAFILHSSFIIHHSAIILHFFYSSSFRRFRPKVPSCCLISFRLVVPKFLQPSSSSSARLASSASRLRFSRCRALRLRTDGSRSATDLLRISGGRLPTVALTRRATPPAVTPALVGSSAAWPRRRPFCASSALISFNEVSPKFL